jgi:putative transposase
VRKLRQLEEENAQLRKVVADLTQSDVAGGHPPQTMTPAREREMIDVVRTAFGVSICRACRAIPACRGTYYYRSRRSEQAPLRRRIREIAETRMRCGYRPITVLLHREGWQVNVRHVHWLCRLEGLQMRLKAPRRRDIARLRDDRSNATGPNQVWAMDWMYDELFDGRRLWVLTVIDTWSRVCPVVRVCRSATATEVIDALEQGRRQYGRPTTIRVDQGCQFTSEELDLWAYTNGVTLDFIRPGKPTDNAYAESFNPRYGSSASGNPGFSTETMPAKRQKIRAEVRIGDRTPMSSIQRPQRGAEACTTTEILI